DSVVGSYDPNDKLLSPAVLTPDEVTLGETPIAYTIRFQNTGTFLADRVVITDTLPDGLQWNSVAMLDASHPFNWFLNNGVLHFIFDDINLPDSQSD
ncbi:MAG TPA: T9SS C-terminal target domain-containing protein, partial [Flavobacteriales bacterium]|nr:T9SS C-terminal target domain-containing protein [Flavobacteriales bacterium]